MNVIHASQIMLHVVTIHITCDYNYITRDYSHIILANLRFLCSVHVLVRCPIFFAKQDMQNE